ncbi:MAG: hypothetical protein R3F56_00650 [Planctomycetota bacterium]
MATEDKDVAERRRDFRQSLAGTVTVRLQAQDIVGPGENVSPDGVFFVAEAALPVEVILPGTSEVRQGELVRVTQMGAGRVGVAIRFPPAP